jgi:hypothetical protein
MDNTGVGWGSTDPSFFIFFTVDFQYMFEYTESTNGLDTQFIINFPVIYYGKQNEKH